MRKILHNAKTAPQWQAIKAHPGKTRKNKQESRDEQPLEIEPPLDEIRV